MINNLYIITGGGSGTGLATSKKLLQQGNTTIIWGRNEAKLQKAVEDGYASSFQVVDISNPDEVKAGFKNSSSKGEVAGVVHAAGVWSPGTLEELDSARIERHINIVTTGSIWVAREAVRYFSEKAGKIVMIAAASAKPGFVDTALNTLAKRAIDGLNEALAREILDENITLTTIYPDSIGEPGSEGVINGDTMTYEDVANAVMFALNAADSVQVREILLTAPNSSR